jgi:hypothetical protein
LCFQLFQNKVFEKRLNTKQRKTQGTFLVFSFAKCDAYSVGVNALCK